MTHLGGPIDALNGPFFDVESNSGSSAKLKLHPSTPLCEAQERTFELWHGGVTCPLCGQRVKLQPRGLNSLVVLPLIWLCKKYREDPRWYHMPSEAPRWAIEHMQYGLLHWWGLAASYDRGHSGHWMPLERGYDFTEGRLPYLPQYVHTFNDTGFGFSSKGISVADALGERFNYEEMMSLTAPELDLRAGVILEEMKRQKEAKRAA